MRSEPLLALSSSIHANPGSYAFLVGSGLSSGAGIQTGWEIAIDLVRRIAVLENEEVPDDPVSWYQERHQNDVDYSAILERLAPSQGDRQALLQQYFEPSEEDLELGIKVPTAGHRALAALVKQGYVRVIVTTNFDRLIERALQEQGIEPLVVASTDDARNAPSLHHVRCVVVKVNGDQQSPNLRNTLDELDAYDDDLAAYLCEIFRNYGLVVCGWSADWDHALRKLLLENDSRFYATFWAHRSDPTLSASSVIKIRSAKCIRIDDADSFFVSIESKISALANITAASPSSLQVRVAEVKRLLADPVHRVRLHDVLMHEVEEVVEQTRIAMTPFPASPSLETYLAKVNELDDLTRPLATLIATLCYYGDDHRHTELVVRALRRLSERTVQSSGFTIYIHLQMYSTLLCFFAAGLAGLAAGNINAFATAMAQIRLPNNYGKLVRIAYRISPGHILESGLLKQSDEFLRHRLPASDYLHSRLRKPLGELVADANYDHLFDELEYLFGLIVVDETSEWGPLGRFSAQYSIHEGDVFQDTRNRYQNVLLGIGPFDGSPDRFRKAVDIYNSIWEKTHHF